MVTQSSFDEVVDRRGTGSLKWDGMHKRFGVEGSDILPMWVADTEFRAPEPVIEALTRRARHGLFGYCRPAAYFEAIQGGCDGGTVGTSKRSGCGHARRGAP
jgi:cystathionine beta-lyase